MPTPPSATPGCAPIVRWWSRPCRRTPSSLGRRVGAEARREIAPQAWRWAGRLMPACRWRRSRRASARSRAAVVRVPDAAVGRGGVEPLAVGVHADSAFTRPATRGVPAAWPVDDRRRAERQPHVASRVGGRGQRPGGAGRGRARGGCRAAATDPRGGERARRGRARRAPCQEPWPPAADRRRRLAARCRRPRVAGSRRRRSSSLVALRSWSGATRIQPSRSSAGVSGRSAVWVAARIASVRHVAGVSRHEEVLVGAEHRHLRQPHLALGVEVGLDEHRAGAQRRRDGGEARADPVAGERERLARQHAGRQSPCRPGA